MALVRRPSVTSINFLSSLASSFNFLTGEEPGLTTARMRLTLTALPKPMLTSRLSMDDQRRTGGNGTGCEQSLFDVLNLFAQFLNFILHLNTKMGDAGVGDF